MAAPKKNRGLGRGLDALFGSAEVSFDPPAEQKEDTNETVEKTDGKQEAANKPAPASKPEKADN